MSTPSSPSRSTEHRLEPAGVAQEATEQNYSSRRQSNPSVLLNELPTGLQHRATPLLCPGLGFLQDGQFEKRSKNLAVDLRRRSAGSRLDDFGIRLRNCVHLPPTRDGEWSLVNSASSQCYVQLPFDGLRGRTGTGLDAFRSI